MTSATPHRSVDLLVRDPSGRVLLQFRDSRAATAPLAWGFWGGAVDAGDPSIEHAAAREVGEELGIAATPQQFTRIGQRVGSDGATATLCALGPRVSWPALDIREGAGAAFFTVAEMRLLDVTRAVRFYLDNDPLVFSDAPPPSPEAVP